MSDRRGFIKSVGSFAGGLTLFPLTHSLTAGVPGFELKDAVGSS